MKTTKQLAVTAATAALLVSSAIAATYNDSTGDLLGAGWATHLDITSVEVNNTATDISFKINLAGDPVATSWGEYQISIDSILGGATSGTVPNGRPISMSSGMDYWVRSWNGGAETYHWNAGGPYWAQDNATWGANLGNLQVPVRTSSSVTLTTSLASLGLAGGDSFYFDISSSGGTPTDGAIDALANPNPTAASGDWVSPYDSGANVYQYTVTAVPEPASMALAVVGLSALVLLRRKVS
jgi:hypothetical protein